MKKFTFLSILLIYSSLLIVHCSLFSQDLEFYKEELKFTLTKDYFSVDGIYYLSNPTNKLIDRMLFYPFPVDSAYGDVDSVFIVKLDNTPAQVKYSNNTNKSLYFNVSIPAYDFTKYRIHYRQKVLKNKAEYILVTTNYWGRPLETVNYTLSAYNLKISSFSYQPDSSRFLDNSQTYYWSKKNFMPRKNFIISWK
jgi:hypothetical protein